MDKTLKNNSFNAQSMTIDLKGFYRH